MKERVSLKLCRDTILLELSLLFLCIHESNCSHIENRQGPVLMVKRADDFLPAMSPSGPPQPFLPLLAPSPLVPFMNSTVPKLSVCPLVFPDMRHVAKGCGNGISNHTECCNAMDGYVSHLQKQSLVTNLQALDCAASLGMKLQKSNITKNVYSLCHISLKDFSLQVGNQESGCLLPSLPSDATFDMSTGVSFICDLNDNIPAPWPSMSQLQASCNKTVTIPALPAVASAQSALYDEDMVSFVLFASSVILMMFL